MLLAESWMPDSEVKSFETYFRSFWREATQFCFSNSSTRLYHSACFLLGLGPRCVKFPVAAIASYHGLRGLRQQKYIPSQFWRPEVQNPRVSRPASLQSLYGKVPPCFFQLLVVPGVPFLGTATATAKSLQSCRLCATPSLGFSRQGHWSGLPFPSPMHKSEK